MRPLHPRCQQQYRGDVIKNIAHIPSIKILCKFDQNFHYSNERKIVFILKFILSSTVISEAARKLHTVDTPDVPVPKQHSAVGGVVAAFIIVTLLCSFAGWVLYAFKNPHTRSGQILIRVRICSTRLLSYNYLYFYT